LIGPFSGRPVKPAWDDCLLDIILRLRSASCSNALDAKYRMAE
jgi:hypothetical protein